jgi:hypothetical protein
LPDENPDLEKLATVERVIAALELLVSECETRDLKRLAKHIGAAAEKCQAEYVNFHRRVYRQRGAKPPPSETEH